MKQLDRLLFEQGNQCFFCRKSLKPTDASIEHLVASANGGANSEENCVACCKKLNALLGSKSLKDKIQIVLNQRGSFRCPEDVERERLASVAGATTPAATGPSKSPPHPPSAAKPKSNPQAMPQAKQQPKPSPQAVPRKQLPVVTPKLPVPLSVEAHTSGVPGRRLAPPPPTTGPLERVACPTCKRTFSARANGGGYRCNHRDSVFRY